MKILINLLCCFIPDKKLRQELRNKFVKSPQRRKKLLDYGCTIEGDVALTKEHVRFDISDYAKASALIGEIFDKKIYNLECKDNSIVIDIGMNRAIASLFFAAKDNIKKIYAFEPFAPTIELANKNLALNPRLNKKIRIFNFGLGKEDKSLQISYSVSLSDCMSTSRNISVKKNVQTETVAIKDAARVLDPIFDENNGMRIIVKCDCEGAEFEIFERLDEKNVMRKIDAVLMEYHFEGPDRIVGILVKNGFAVHFLNGSGCRYNTGYLYAVKMQKI